MRLPAGLLLLCLAGPAVAEQKVAYDFRGARFDAEQLAYTGPTPDQFLKPEADGLRLRYPGAGVPPTNNPAGVAWRYHVRGNFVATAHYEILRNEPPAKGTFLAGVELYLKLNNPTSDAIMVARGVYPKGSTAFDFKVLTSDGKGKRVTRDFKLHPTTDKSLRGRLRLARTGPIVAASFAEGDEGPFTEFQRAEVGTADVQRVRLAGIAGGDRSVVLDMRILELGIEGDDVALDGRFTTSPPKALAKKTEPDAPRAVAEPVVQPAAVPAPAPEPTRNIMPLALALALLAMAVLVTVGIVALWLRNKAVRGNAKCKQGG
jgi:hypothetical protein